MEERGEGGGGRGGKEKREGEKKEEGRNRSVRDTETQIKLLVVPSARARTHARLGIIK